MLQRIAHSFFLAWLIITVLYVALFFTVTETLPQVVALVGLFVPYGVLNTLVSVALLQNGNLLAFVPLLALLVCFWGAPYVLARSGISTTWGKVLFNLSVLLLLTLITDLVLYGEWASLSLLFGQGISFGA